MCGQRRAWGLSLASQPLGIAKPHRRALCSPGPLAAALGPHSRPAHPFLRLHLWPQVRKEAQQPCPVGTLPPLRSTKGFLQLQ